MPVSQHDYEWFKEHTLDYITDNLDLDDRDWMDRLCEQDPECKQSLEHVKRIAKVLQFGGAVSGMS